MNEWFDQAETRPRARVTRVLTSLNVAAFALIWWMRLVGISWVNAYFGIVPARFTADPVGESVKLLCALFVHDGLPHLLWNLLFLLLFAPRLERRIGSPRFLFFYLLTGVLSFLAQHAVDPYSSIPLVGCSGAIAGVLGGFLVLFPRQPITVFRWPAFHLIGIWFVLNLIGGFASMESTSSDTAFFAHIGGFAAGLVLIRLFSGPSADDTDFPTFGGQSRVVRPPIFRKDADGPFWRSHGNR